jgi:hypothetical protein
MQAKFEISILEKLVAPENLLDLLDQLMNDGKLDEYYWDWENGYVTLTISKKAIIDELFRTANKDKLQ